MKIRQDATGFSSKKFGKNSKCASQALIETTPVTPWLLIVIWKKLDGQIGNFTCKIF